MASELVSVPLTDGSTMLVLPEVMQLKEETIANRRWFHQYPEIAFTEVKTAAKVVELLLQIGIPQSDIFTQIGVTGVVALIHGSRPGPCIALRADMDGLPVTETADIPYKSTNGNMHACGHDGHMAGMLTAVKILFNERDSFSGTIKVMFQPAEEGLGGAREMIKDGVLEEGKCGPRVDFIYGAHLWTVDPVGCVGCRDGPVMAASDRFDIDVRGKGGHGAAPHQTVDAIVEAAHLITALQTVVSRSIDPLETGVVTVGKVHGGVAYNVICDHVEVTGTCRSFTPEVQQTIESRMSAICCGIASTYGGQIDFKYKKGYPPTVNAYPDEVKNVQNAARPFVGDVRCSWPQRTTGAEDFSYYLLQRPGCFFFVGAALPGPPRPHHKSVFDFDENAMLLSASVFVQLIRSLMVKP